MSVIKPLPRWADLILLPFINLCTAFFVCGIVVYIIGENPWDALMVMLKGAFIYPGSLGYTLYYTTNFIFTGLAVATAFHAKLFNIGGEGQAYVGSLGILLATALFAPFLPALFVVLLCIICSALIGAAWAFIPGYLQAKRGSHVVITTIMFNFLASS
ncbi:MAG: ABC transporter permease, partial [Amylibacter sp.]|nr:ABC transporter permease [Amylibacter sp.]